MAKSLVQPPAGVPEMFALLQLLTNPDAVHEKLSQLEAARDQLNDSIQREETLARLQELESKAKQQLAESTEVLQAARAQAAEALSRAQGDINASRAALSASRDEWTKERTRMSDELVAKLKSADDRERAAAIATETARTRTERAEYRFTEATKLIEEYNEKLAALKGIVQGPA